MLSGANPKHLEDDKHQERCPFCSRISIQLLRQSALRVSVHCPVGTRRLTTYGPSNAMDMDIARAMSANYAKLSPIGRIEVASPFRTDEKAFPRQSNLELEAKRTDASSNHQGLLRSFMNGLRRPEKSSERPGLARIEIVRAASQFGICLKLIQIKHVEMKSISNVLA